MKGPFVLRSFEELRRIASERLDEKRKRPIWLQIYDRLGMAMQAGVLAEGTRLPGEDDLAALFGVSRVTLRRALARHQREGRLVARKGVGVFVRSMAVRYVVHQHEAFHDTPGNAEIRTETLSLARKPASGATADAFGVKPGAAVIELQLRRILGAAPFYLTTKEFPASIFPNFESVYGDTGTIIGVYAAAGIDSYVRAETRILGDFAGAREADLLRISVGAPLIRARSHNTDLRGRVIEISRGYWPLCSVELVFDNAPGAG